ncbi:hypothetical protein P0Y43_14640 [Pseudomonas entomophila]|uniref:hypothetical protein n=1 Tax=Pseudomonas entomophila TaxID=312306 RepID=UPI0023D89DB2|nr:hypothetical protein [Pseudomonas entomophila]MDF0731951.1 hypothetical protein [Pseudomonas entomophila]
MISINGLGWQNPVQQPSRSGNEQPLAEALQFRTPMATSKTATEQNSQGNTSQQNAEDARQEAFAKLKVLLQNPDVAARQQASASTPKLPATSATEAFRDYMDKTPEEKIKAKFLAEMGLTEDEYNALPPEQKEKIDNQIAQRMKDEIELKTQAKVQQAEAASQANQLGSLTDPAQARKQNEDKQQAVEV